MLAFHRWVEGVGEDVVVVGSLNEQRLRGYSVGFPQLGCWRDALNSDAYDSSSEYVTTGNAWRILADGSPAHGMPSIVIPANSILIFQRG